MHSHFLVHFFLVRFLEFEAACGQGIHDRDQDVAAISRAVVSHPVEVLEVSQAEVSDRSHLFSADLPSANQEGTGGRGDGDERAGQLNFHVILAFQLKGVFGAVVDILAEVRKCRRGGEVDAAGGRAQLVLLCGRSCRVELVQQHSGVDLELIEGFNRNLCVFHAFAPFSKKSYIRQSR